MVKVVVLPCDPEIPLLVFAVAPFAPGTDAATEYVSLLPKSEAASVKSTTPAPPPPAPPLIALLVEFFAPPPPDPPPPISTSLIA
jgi:hypothetical protein